MRNATTPMLVTEGAVKLIPRGESKLGIPYIEIVDRTEIAGTAVEDRAYIYMRADPAALKRACDAFNAALAEEPVATEIAA